MGPSRSGPAGVSAAGSAVQGQASSLSTSVPGRPSSTGRPHPLLPQVQVRLKATWFSWVLVVLLSESLLPPPSSPPVRDLVDEAKDFHLMPARRPHLPAFKTRQRCCTSISGLIYAVGGLNSSGEVPTCSSRSCLSNEVAHLNTPSICSCYCYFLLPSAKKCAHVCSFSYSIYPESFPWG